MDQTALAPIWGQIKTAIFAGDFAKALTLMETHQKELWKDNPLRLINLQTDCLLELGRFRAAEQMLDRYAEEAYVSQEVEDCLVANRAQIEKRRPVIKDSERFTEAEITRLLAADAPLAQQTDLLLHLAQGPLEQHLPALVSALTTVRDNDNQGLIILLLTKANYDQPVSFTRIKTGETFTLVPGQLSAPLTNAYDQAILAKLPSLSKNVTVNQTAEALYLQVALNLYPGSLKASRPTLVLAALEYLAQKLLQMEPDIEKIAKHYRLDPASLSQMGEYLAKLSQ